jgi:hypothetical protein
MRLSAYNNAEQLYFSVDIGGVFKFVETFQLWLKSDNRAPRKHLHHLISCLTHKYLSKRKMSGTKTAKIIKAHTLDLNFP